MKRAILLGALLLAGCGEKKVETPQELQEAFKAQAVATPTNEVQVLVNSAVTALEKKDSAAAVMTLETLRNTPNLTVDQYMAVQDMIAKAQRDLAARAAAGDPQAKAAMEALKYKHR